MQLWNGNDSPKHFEDSTGSFGLSAWSWNVRDKDEVSGYPDFFLTAMVASAKDALVFNWAPSYGKYPVQELTDIMESTMNHWGVEGVEGLVPDFGDFPDPMGIVSNGFVTEDLNQSRVQPPTATVQPQDVISTQEPLGLPQTLDVSWASARAINDRGQIIGSVSYGSGESRATFWEDATGEVIDLGVLSGYAMSTANGINEAGQIVGFSGTAGLMPGAGRAVLWEGGQITDLAPLPGDDQSVATAINDSGVIVGASLTADGFRRTVLWQEGQVVDLGTLPGDTSSEAYGINDAGRIVGTSWSPSTEWRAVLWEGWTAGDTRVVNLGSLPEDRQSHAYGINNAGQIVGTSWTSEGSRRAVLWENGKISDLGTLPGHMKTEANAINDRGHIVGVASAGDAEAHHAVLWENGKVIDLGTLAGDKGSRAEDINNAGQIVGESYFFSESNQADIVGRAVIWDGGVLNRSHGLKS